MFPPGVQPPFLPVPPRVPPGLPQGPVPEGYAPPPTQPPALPAPYVQALIDAIVGGATPLGSEAAGDSRAARFGELLTGLPTEAIALPLTTALRLGRDLPKASRQLKSLGAINREFRMYRGGANLKAGELYQALEPGAELGKYKVKADVLERMRDMWRRGEGGQIADWRGIDSPELRRAFTDPKTGQVEEDALELYLRFWAALSPGTNVPKNTHESVGAFRHFLEHPDQPFTIENMGRMLRPSPSGKPSIGNRGAKRPNLIFSTWGLNPVQKDSPKVYRMTDFMLGKEGMIPIDTHAIYALGYQGDKLATENKSLADFFRSIEGDVIRKGEVGDVQVYERLEQAIVDALKEIAPAQDSRKAFGQMWEGARQHKSEFGVANLGFVGGPVDILRKKGLLDVGAMLDPAKLRAALAKAGWTAKSIAAFMSMLGAYQMSQQAGGGEEPAPPQAPSIFPGTSPYATMRGLGGPP